MDNFSGLSSITALIENCFRGKHQPGPRWYKYADALIARFFKGDGKNRPPGFDVVQDIIADLLVGKRDSSRINSSNIDKVMKNIIVGVVHNLCKYPCKTISLNSLNRVASPVDEDGMNVGNDYLFEPEDSSEADIYSRTESEDTVNCIRELLINNNMPEELSLFDWRLQGNTISDPDAPVPNSIAVNRRLFHFLIRNKNKLGY